MHKKHNFLSTEKVKSMSIRRRNCIKKYEDLTGTGIKMKGFEEYTRASCLLECRDETNSTLIIPEGNFSICYDKNM